MRRLLLLAFAILLSLELMAQLEVKEGSFKEVPGFVNINPDPIYQTDDNELPFAVIKIRTENINDKQRRELRFEGNGGTFIMLEYKTGEVWVYLTAKYADYLKISHPDFSSIEFALPFDLQPKKGYELTLINKSNDSNDMQYGYLTIRSNQPEAMIYIDSEYVGMGTASKSLIVGVEHHYKVNCSDYFPQNGMIIFDKKEEKEIIITLEPIYGYITIMTEPSNADVYIDDAKVGVTPYQMKKLKQGQHVLELRKNGYENHYDLVTVIAGEVESMTVKLTKSTTTQKSDTSSEPKENKYGANNPPPGAIKAEFSITPYDRVYFSKGNLQYQASTKTWRFAEHQYDVIGKGNKNMSDYYNGWIDLFGWGTASDPTKRDSNNKEYTNPFWSKNAISNGGDKTDVWAVMSKDEWYYLMHKRNTKSGIRYAKAQINGINGIILLPDKWDVKTHDLKDTNKSDAQYNSNIIELSEWNKMELAGAVFLPASGMRVFPMVKKVLSNGYYWTGTPYNFQDSYSVFFNDNEVNPADYFRRCYGFCIRLVFLAKTYKYVQE